MEIVIVTESHFVPSLQQKHRVRFFCNQKVQNYRELKGLEYIVPTAHQWFTIYPRA